MIRSSNLFRLDSHRSAPLVLLAALGALGALVACSISAHAADASDPFRRENLVAWCIVPFDARKRTPPERAEMVQRLGLTKVAYDWRAEHVPTFEQEILEYQQRGIEFFAFWVIHEEAFRLFEKYGLRPQIWFSALSPQASTQEERIRLAAEQLLPVVERTRKAGCPLGLYNHGGWGGEPENLVAVCEYLRTRHDATHVGIVYNFHHGHDHIDRFPAALELMKPYLLCLNINGMVPGGDRQGHKILALGQGTHEIPMLRTVAQSGYRGPIGIICHRTDADAEQVLADNLDGLQWIRKELTRAGSGGPRPVLRAPLR
jgi:sugar phosphate isomerase/epimerase